MAKNAKQAIFTNLLCENQLLIIKKFNIIGDINALLWKCSKVEKLMIDHKERNFSKILSNDNKKIMLADIS